MNSRWIALMALAALAAALAPAAQAAQEPAIGVMDESRISAEYTAYQEAQKAFDQFMAERQVHYDEANQTGLLTDEEKQELADLKAAAVLTAQQKARMQQLLDLTDERLKELRGLRELATPDEKQQARFKELSDLLERGSKAIQALKDRLDDDIADKQDELMTPINERIDEALASVAKQMGLIAVLVKQSVLYGGKDVTDKVLAELNKEG